MSGLFSEAFFAKISRPDPLLTYQGLASDAYTWEAGWAHSEGFITHVLFRSQDEAECYIRAHGDGDLTIRRIPRGGKP